jgi:hypothetical protein
MNIFELKTRHRATASDSGIYQGTMQEVLGSTGCFVTFSTTHYYSSAIPRNGLCSQRWRIYKYLTSNINASSILFRSQWPSGLRRGSTDSCILGLQVRIPPGVWLSVSSKCCVVRSVTGRSLAQRSPTDCGVSLSVTQKFKKMRGAGPRWAVAPKKKKIIGMQVTCGCGSSGCF